MIQVKIEARNGVSLSPPQILGLQVQRIITIRPVGLLFDFEYADTQDRRVNPPLLRTSDNLTALVTLADYFDTTVYDGTGTYQLYVKKEDIITMEDTFILIGQTEQTCVLIRYNEGAFSEKAIYVAGQLSDFIP